MKSFYDDDGSLVIRGRFPAEDGALVLKALRHAMERRDREIAEERRRLREAGKATEECAEAPAEVSAETPDEAFARACVRSRRRSLQKHPEEAVRPLQPWTTRCADALVQLAQTYLSQGPKSSTGGDNCQVVVHVSAETLKAVPPACSTGTEN